LVEHQEAVLFVADNQRGGEGEVIRGQPGEALHRLLKQALVSGKHEELFGEARARKRPQAGAGATAEDDGLEGYFFLSGFHGM
jgi:hypothetical protein